MTLTIATCRFAEDLGQKIIHPYKAWFLDGQVAGFKTVYDRLVFTTIRGAGHMVPSDKPKIAYVMLDGFLSGEIFK